MKYVRLNYGKIEPTSDNKTVEQLNDIYKQFGLDQRAIEIADTIEQLIDKFVCGQTILRSKEDAFMATGIEIKIPDVYGAIWTDKGLIYVAKMNDKGELELL